jgi:hypothetical protein
MPRKHSSPKARVKVEFDQGPSRPPPPSKLDIDLGKIPPPTPSRRSSLATAKTLFGALNTSNIQSSTVQRPRIPTFSGDQKGETTFKVWKFEVKCIIREGDYSDVVILQSIRSSLKGPARNLLLTLSENAIPWQILDELEGVYSSDALLQIFFFSAVVNFPILF